ncbi:MAG: saccharopine dehydrogenase C-terminal domain-containing protein [Phycisphaerales bacterium]|nr:saccharopine dehydrogenase C-terminal domain-containing protein [Phycisphaerales bacterium]
MTKVLVLGGGLVGSVIARDLAADADLEVSLADIDAKRLEAVCGASADPISAVEADCSSPECVATLCNDHELIVGAMPGRFGYRVLRAVIESGRNYCDISFMPEDAWELDELARTHGATCVVDIGVAPGMSNLLGGRAAFRLDPCHTLDIFVGGIPANPRPPFEYKAGFSPADVLEEYVRPARLVEDGRTVIREALSEPESIDFPGVGVLEAFNTDGLRSLADRLDVPSMREKTMRYPGHREVMLQMREAGFLGEEPVRVGDVDIVPRDLAAALLFPHWTYEEGEADLTAMRVEATGELEGRTVRLRWDLLDYYDPATGFSSMARTTAFPCAIMARLIAKGVVDAPGVHPPEEFAARDDVLDALFSGLQARGVHYTEHVDEIS